MGGVVRLLAELKTTGQVGTVATVRTGMLRWLVFGLC
jgi:hypothetical protein